MAHEGSTCAQDLGVAAATAAVTYIREMREGKREGSWTSANHRHVPEHFESLEVWRFGGRGASRSTRCTKPPTGKYS
jgi:hypothetical protein